MTGMTLNVAYAWMVDATYELHFWLHVILRWIVNEVRVPLRGQYARPMTAEVVETSNPGSVSNLLRHRHTGLEG